MSDPVLGNLLALANAYSLTQSGDNSAGKLILSLTPPGTGGNLPDIVDNVLETVLTNQPVSFDFVLKNVRFATSPITDNTPIGGLPIDDLLTGIVETDANPASKNTTTSAVGGLLATVSGALPLLVPTLTKTTLSVSVDVHWQIRDENGNPVTDVTTSLGTGADFFVPTAQALLPVVVSLAPTVVEFTDQLPPSPKRIITASINLTALDGTALRTTTGWISLPPVTIQVLAIPIPTMAVFFSNSNYKGHALVAVPANSPLALSSVVSSLNAVSAALSSPLVSALLDIFGFATGLTALVQNLNSATHVYFKHADGVSDLSNVELQHPSFGDPAGMNADDDLSAVVYLAAPGRALQCFNDSGFKDDEGQFTLSTTLQAGLLVQIPDLKKVAEAPPDIHIDKKPTGWNGAKAREVRSFNDELSSYRFVTLSAS